MGNCSSCGAGWNKAATHSPRPASAREKTKSGRCCSKASTPTVRPITRTESDAVLPNKLKCFSLSDLKCATRNFRPDSVLGHGGFGSVFKGWVDESSLGATKPGTGKVIAVKKLNNEGSQGHREWLAEITYLGQLEHPNLVKLIGYCLEDEHYLLVYEFMPRGSVENQLFRRGSNFQPLSWDLRMKIALGAARGVAFLHSSVPKVIYRDFKTSNILLDLDFNAKLSDFGLAKDGPSGDSSYVSTRVMGTQGYAAPEYIATGHLSAKSDVYSFGVVLLELLCGKRALDMNRPTGEHNLVDWAKPCLADRLKLYRVLDTRMQGKFPVRQVEQVALLALKCLSLEPKKRPRMGEVVKILEQLQEEKHSALTPASEVSEKKNTTREGIQKTKRNLNDSKSNANAASLRPSSSPIHQ